MTAQQVFNRACNLLGYNDINGEISGEDEIKKNALPKIQTIYEELYRCEGHKDENGENMPLKILGSMNDDIDLSDDTVHMIMPYGVAMLLAQSEGDADNQSIMAALYTRAMARLTHIERNGRQNIFGGGW